MSASPSPSEIGATSVESLQRFLLGYGFLATALYLLLIAMPVLPLLTRRRWSESTAPRALTATPADKIGTDCQCFGRLFRPRAQTRGSS